MDWANGKAKHMLVIDDHQDTLELFREVLEEEGYHVTCATVPHLEPHVVADLAPDLILLDLLFDRELHGMSFLERLKSTPETSAIPVLVCSADRALLERVHEQLVAWDCGVLAKPFELEALLAQIEACLDGEPISTAYRDHALPVDR